MGFLGEQGSLQFRAEFFNILNHTNLGFPSTASYAGTATDFCASPFPTCNGGVNFEAPSGASATKPLGTAGQITTTATNSRQIQLALKIIF